MHLKSSFNTLATLLCALMAVVLAGCPGGGDSGDGDEPGTQTVPLDLGSQGQNVILMANQVNTVTNERFDLDVLSIGGPFASLDLELAGNLGGVTVARLAETTRVTAQQASTALVSMKIAPVETVDPCATGIEQGPYTVALDTARQPESVTPGSSSASDETVDIINSGGMKLCVQVTPQVDATVTVQTLDLETSGCDAPADIGGYWSGTYQCTTTSGSPGGCDVVDGDITLMITQDGASARYEDFNDSARYQGTVCGNVFSYRGGVSGQYTESGKFTLQSDGSAVKTSNYTPDGGSCSGSCTDQLTPVNVTDN